MIYNLDVFHILAGRGVRLKDFINLYMFFWKYLWQNLFNQINSKTSNGFVIQTSSSITYVWMPLKCISSNSATMIKLRIYRHTPENPQSTNDYKHQKQDNLNVTVHLKLYFVICRYFFKLSHNSEKIKMPVGQFGIDN